MMKTLFEAWQKLALGWKLYAAGVALIAAPVWFNYSLSDASALTGIALFFAAAIWALGD